MESSQVRLTKGLQGASGWDAFCLDYAVGPPVDAVLTEGAMKAYRQASTFLWRLS